MAGVAAVQRRLSTALDTRLRGQSRDFYGSDAKFLTAEGTVCYPGGMVVCGPVNLNATYVESPVVVFEVLSPSTTRADCIAKVREYQATPSVQRYVMLEQDGVAAVAYARAAAVWTHDILTAESVLALPEIGVELPLAELYEGIAFETDEDSETV